MTNEGKIYFAECRQALSQLIDAERLVTGAQIAPSGLLRISVPTPYAHFRLLPLLPEFQERYPQVQIDIHLSNRNIDFTEEGYDLAIRGRTPADSNLIARPLEHAELVVVATPDYLSRVAYPNTLDDLRHLECIQFELPSTGRRIPWLFRQENKIIEVVTSGSYCCSEDYLGIVTLARNGIGLVQTYRYIVEKDLQNGALIELLPQFGGVSLPFILLYPHGRHMSFRVRVFVDFLLEKLAG